MPTYLVQTYSGKRNIVVAKTYQRALRLGYAKYRRLRLTSEHYMTSNQRHRQRRAERERSS